MNNQYDLTVILAIYNMEQYIAKCLDSIVAQQNMNDYRLRIICVNDGSTDNTAHIIQNYCQQYSFIELHTKVNGGVSDARNYGLSLVENSKYTTFLDPDDTWQPNYLTEVGKGMMTNVDAIFFNINLVDRKDKLIKQLTITKENHSKEAFMLAKQASWTRIHRSDLFQGMKFPTGIIYEDLALMPYITSRCQSFYYCESFIYNYVIDVKNSIMNNQQSTIFDIYAALTYLFELFGTDFERYKHELHYLALEHLCVGQSYRLLNYPKAALADYQQINTFMSQHFGQQWHKNKYIRQGIQKNNINSALSYVVPQFLWALKNGILFKLLRLRGLK